MPFVEAPEIAPAVLAVGVGDVLIVKSRESDGEPWRWLLFYQAAAPGALGRCDDTGRTDECAALGGHDGEPVKLPAGLAMFFDNSASAGELMIALSEVRDSLAEHERGAVAPSEPQHVSDSDLAAFSEARLHGEERDRVAEHMADCDICRDSLAEVMAAVDDDRVVVSRNDLKELLNGFVTGACSQDALNNLYIALHGEEVVKGPARNETPISTRVATPAAGSLGTSPSPASSPRDRERDLLAAEFGWCCGGADPYCSLGCLVIKAMRRAACRGPVPLAPEPPAAQPSTRLAALEGVPLNDTEAPPQTEEQSGADAAQPETAPTEQPAEKPADAPTGDPEE